MSARGPAPRAGGGRSRPDRPTHAHRGLAGPGPAVAGCWDPGGRGVPVRAPCHGGVGQGWGRGEPSGHRVLGIRYGAAVARRLAGLGGGRGPSCHGGCPDPVRSRCHGTCGRDPPITGCPDPVRSHRHGACGRAGGDPPVTGCSAPILPSWRTRQPQGPPPPSCRPFPLHASVKRFPSAPPAPKFGSTSARRAGAGVCSEHPGET